LSSLSSAARSSGRYFDVVSERALRERAAAACLRFERRVGPPFGYFGVLRADHRDKGHVVVHAHH
jgi:hypothetical protein